MGDELNNPQTVERKLATILSADVAQYSRLMAENEEQTLQAFAAHKQIFESLVALHRGRIFNMAGDAILAEFGSAVEAVRCAIKIQAALRARNDQFPPARQVRFRIGVNLGDVMVQGADLLGDGINVAARLQSAAEPGGICISGSVYDQIRNKIALSSKLIGEQKYKNIPQLVRTYSITESESYDNASPAGMFAVSNIPIRVPAHFMGRDDALAAVEAALARYEGRVAITALHGLRGIGKTTLAAAYADRHRGSYRATWWIRAQTEPSMRADLVALGVRLGWAGAEDKEDPALATVMERLRHEGEAILLIFDNATDANALKPFLPRGGSARVLVTSNAHAWRGVAVPVEVRLWPKEIGADYLVARTGRENERNAAELLSEALGGLPLAHEQAAAYCERLDITFAEYGRRFAAAPARLLDDARHAPTEYHDGLTVAKTFALAIEEAAKLHSGAEPLIAHAALLAPEPIPLFLFSEGREKFGDPLTTALAGDGLDEAMAALRAFALVDREVIVDERDPAITTETIRLHRLIREITAARHTSESREHVLCALVEAVVAAYPEDLVNPKSWPRARRLDAPALALVSGNDALPTRAEVQAAELLHRLTSYRLEFAASYAQARSLSERALAIRQRTLGAEHPDTATSLNDLGSSIQGQGHFAEARPLYERALAIHEKALGAENDATVTNMHNLGALLMQQGDFAGARPLIERSLAIYERGIGPEYRLVHSLGNLCVAQLLQAQGDLAAARPLYERALAIDEKVLGPEHMNTNRCRHHLAAWLLASGNASEALALGKAALAAHHKVLGPTHRWTKDSARVTADALAVLGRAEEASAMRERFGLIAQ